MFLNPFITASVLATTYSQHLHCIVEVLISSLKNNALLLLGVWLLSLMVQVLFSWLSECSTMCNHWGRDCAAVKPATVRFVAFFRSELNDKGKSGMSVQG